MKSSLMLIVISVGIGLVGFSGYRLFVNSQAREATSQNNKSTSDQFQQQQEELFRQLVSASEKRGELFLKMAEKNLFTTEQTMQIKGTIEFLKQATFESQDAIDRFDQLHNQLSQILASYFDKNKKDLNKVNSLANNYLREFQIMDKTVDELKKRHSTLVQSMAGSSGADAKKLPHFRAAMMALEASQANK